MIRAPAVLTRIHLRPRLTRLAPAVLHLTQTPVTPVLVLIAKEENPARKCHGHLKMIREKSLLRRKGVKINRVQKVSETNCKSIWLKLKNAGGKPENRFLMCINKKYV